MKIKNQIEPEFLEACVTGADSEELIKLAKKKGIVLPSDHLGAFKTVYARIGDANRNGVRLSREAVEKALPSLIGSQVNINHWRQNWTCGSIFWAKINDNDEIEVGFSFFKDIYKKEFDIASALFEDGELTVSFELNANPDAIEYHDDGTRTLNDVTFVGCGLLLDENPAEPTAIVFEMAKRRVMELIRNDTPELVYAKEAVINCQDLLETINKALKEKEEKSNTTLDLPKKEANKNKKEVSDINIDEDIKEGGIQMDKVEDKKPVKIQVKLEADEKAEVKTDVKAEVKTEEKAEEANYECECLDCGKITSIDGHCKDTKCPSCGGKMRRKDRPGPGQKASEEKEDAAAKIVTEENKVVTETMDDNSNTVEVESEVKQTVVIDNEVVSEVKSEVSEKTTYTFAEVEAIKAEYEATIETLKASLESKDADIEVAKEKAVKVEKLKAKLGEYVKDFSDEDFDNVDKLENARLRKENDKLKAVKVEKSTEEKVEEKAEVSTEDKSVKSTEEASEEDAIETASLDTGHKETPVAKVSALVELTREKMKKSK